MTFPEQFRWNGVPHGYQTKKGDPYGLFIVPAQQAHGRSLKVIATDGELTNWEHVSVSLVDRADKCPSWDEMCLIKSLFWNEQERVIQFHPPKSEHVNFHQGCLHLWRHTTIDFPQPPSILVGPKITHSP